MPSLRSHDDPFLAEICAQPDALRRAAASFEAQRADLEAIREAAARAKTIIFTGMGSSYDACYPAVNDLAGRGVPSLLVDTAELLHFRRAVLGPDALVVIVSQSGESAEIVKLVAEFEHSRRPPFVISVTNGLDNDLARRADARLDTAVGPEAGPSTITFSGAMAVLSGIARLLAGDSVNTAIDRTHTAAEDAARAQERLLEDPEVRAASLATWLGERDVIVVLGRGPARAAAEMGALLLKECGVMAESLESAMFRHGPLELAGTRMAAVVLATEPETRRLDLGLADDLVDAGSAVLVVTPDGQAPTGSESFGIGYLDRALVSAVSIVPIQLLAWRKSLDLGRTPGAYTRAAKVTTRE